MQLQFTHLLLVIILSCSMLGFAFRKIYFSFIFHPASFPFKKNYHTLFSHALIHFNYPHQIINMLGLYVFGLELEEYLNQNQMPAYLILIIFSLGVLITAAIAFKLYQNNTSFSLVGASNGIFCLLGSLLVLQPVKTIHFMPIPIPNIYLTIGFVVLFLIKFYRFKNNIDIIGHLAGFLTGIGFGFFIKIAGFPAI